MNKILLLSIFLLTSCSCLHTTPLRGTTGFTVQVSDKWERLPNPPSVVSNQMEAVTLVNQSTKNMVIFATSVRVDANLALMLLSVAASERPGFKVTEVSESNWVPKAFEFDAVADDMLIKIIALSTDKYTYFVQCFASSDVGFSSDTANMVKSFVVK